MKLNRQPVSQTSFADSSPVLVNGKPMTYGVGPVFLRRDHHSVEGPMATLQAIPSAVPPGFLGVSTNEGDQPGSVTFDAATGGITLRGSGADIFSSVDGYYFLTQPVAGDFRITAKLLTLPTATSEWAHAGVMIRDSLQPDARHAFVTVTAEHGLQVKRRAAPGDTTEAQNLIPKDQIKPPMLLRLTRRGSTIAAESSTDNGGSFQPAGQPVTFDPPLASTVYAGLAITAHDESQVSEAKFSGLEIRKR